VIEGGGAGEEIQNIEEVGVARSGWRCLGCERQVGPEGRLARKEKEGRGLRRKKTTGEGAARLSGGDHGCEEEDRIGRAG
jgi:hypothetical protein